MSIERNIKKADFGYSFVNEHFQQRYAAAQTAQGASYKDCSVYRNTLNRICYIPGYQLKEVENLNPQEALPDKFGYTHQDFLDLCKGNEVLAKICFCSCDCQDPAQWLAEAMYTNQAFIDAAGNKIPLMAPDADNRQPITQNLDKAQDAEETPISVDTKRAIEILKKSNEALLQQIKALLSHKTMAETSGLGMRLYEGVTYCREEYAAVEKAISALEFCWHKQPELPNSEETGSFLLFTNEQKLVIANYKSGCWIDSNMTAWFPHSILRWLRIPAE